MYIFERIITISVTFGTFIFVFRSTKRFLNQALCSFERIDVFGHIRGKWNKRFHFLFEYSEHGETYFMIARRTHSTIDRGKKNENAYKAEP